MSQVRFGKLKWKGIILACGSAVTLFTVGCAGLIHAHTGPLTVFAYVATGTNIGEYFVPASGQLTPLPPVTVSATNAVAITTTADSQFAYAVNKSSGTV